LINPTSAIKIWRIIFNKKMNTTKIEKLTDAQVEKMSEYVTKWTAAGLTTTRCSLTNAKKDFYNFQQQVLKQEPAPVELYDSPAKCWDRVNQIYSEKEGRAVNLKFVYPYFDCQFWAGWYGFYEFMRNELGIKYTNSKEYEAFLACRGYGMVFPLTEACIVCQPPTIIKKNTSGLHCEDGPALSYNGDNEIYALNGVVMSKEYVLTPSNKLDAKTIMSETNVEVRRELIRKIGIETLMNNLPHKLLDMRGNYELYSIELSPEIKDAKFLKMINPSIGVYHVEGVAPEIKTVSEALKWRNQQMFEDADVLT